MCTGPPKVASDFQGCIFYIFSTQNKERHNLECVDVFPECSYALWDMSLAMWLEQWVSITLKCIQCFHISDNVPWNMSCESFAKHCHHVVEWRRFIELRTLFIMKHWNIYTLSLLYKTQTTCVMRSRKNLFISTTKWDQLTEGLVLKMKHDHTTDICEVKHETESLFKFGWPGCRSTGRSTPL